MRVDEPTVATPQGLADRGDLAFIAVERTRMPMVVTDARHPSNPIVLANRALLELTGYGAEEIVGRNCRFLQGPKTDPAALQQVRDAVAEGRELTVELLNYRRDGSTFWNQLFISPVHDEDGHLLYFFGSLLDVTGKRAVQDLEAAEHRLLREVDHRAKNVLALVQGIVRLSRADTAEQYALSVQGRVDALARAHGILADGRWRGVPLDRLIASEAEGYGPRRIQASGPRVELAASQVQPLALVLHELFDNAQRYGALSAKHGTISLDWCLNEGADEVRLRWQERGAPVPPVERKTGFGWSIIDAMVRRQLRGTATFDWPSDGMGADLAVPLKTAAPPAATAVPA